MHTRHSASKSAAFRYFQSVGFCPDSRDLSLWTTIIHFSGLNTEPAILLHPAPDFRYRFCLWTSLMSCWLNFAHMGLSRISLLSATASPARRLTVRTILPNVRASSTKGYTASAICDHPLGNNIKFHLPFGRIPTIRTSLGARMPRFDITILS